MGLPLFSVGDDPGPSFLKYVADSGLVDESLYSANDSAHATTVVALRYANGVVLVGDRQATSSYIASRDVRKIEAADRFTAIAISGSRCV